MGCSGKQWICWERVILYEILLGKSLRGHMVLESIIPVPDIFQAKRILAIQPHYDDNDIAVGGTLAKLAAAGARIDYLTVTDDQLGVIDADLSVAETQAQLRSEQAKAGEIIGVAEQYWLSYPDAGEYSVDGLTRDIIRVMRRLKPDFLFCPDPWLTYEAHLDHLRTGQAAAYASQLFGLPRWKTDPETDASFTPYELQGVAFYFTRVPNVTPDIADMKVKKEQALRCYQTQFSSEEMDQLLMVLEMKSKTWGEEHGVDFAEGFKAMHPLQLHCGF